MPEILKFVSENIVLSIFIGLGIFLVIVFFHDIIQRKSSIKHNFPVVGHLRYLLELVGPELRQYWVATDKEEMPFNRAERRWVYATAKKQNNNFGFGTTEQLYEAGYPIIKHAAFPFPEEKAYKINSDSTAIPCLKKIGLSHKRAKSWRPPSIINISAMSFGALGENAISALNLGARASGCFQNTGEGGISPYHLHGGDLVWQLGTGYFGALDNNGKFSLDVLVQKVQQTPTVKMIEIKLSQGAKPGKGGILPGAKVTREVAQIRGVQKGEDCISPNYHSEFSDVKTMIAFIEKIANATGLPVGIKSAIGELEFWQELATEMKKSKKGPDFIAIDGGEGGTGAAPLTFSDHVALPFKTGFVRVYNIFQKAKLTEDIAFIGAGKLGFPDRAAVALAMGCDLVYVAREPMLAIGCIQAQKCHTGHCPAGVATMNPWLQAGLNIEQKAKRAEQYIKGCRKELLGLAHAVGYEHPSQFQLKDIEISIGLNRYQSMQENLGYQRAPVKFKGIEHYID